MRDRRIRIDVIVALLLSTAFIAIAAVLWSPIVPEAIANGGEINVLLRPYLNFMSAMAIANAILILVMVPIFHRTSGRLKEILIWITVIASTLIVSELSAFYFAKNHFRGSRFTNSVEFSPDMGVVLKPNFRYPLSEGEVTHTAEGFRGPASQWQISDTRKTFVLIGGSSTYDLGVPDDQTWPTNLGRIFEKQANILNMGIPGHSTAEHIILSSTIAWRYHPDVIVYYIGWNDIRSSHVNESSDYSRFHKRNIYDPFAITEPRSFFALGFLLKYILARLDEVSLYNISKVDIEPGFDDSVDEELLTIYVHNVKILAAITRAIGATPVFVPQIMNAHKLTSEEATYGWIPRVPERAVPKILKVFNEAMIQTARASGAIVISEVLNVDWQDSDFVDKGHFSKVGAQRFACVLAAGLLEYGLVDDTPNPSANLAANCGEEYLAESSASIIARSKASE